MTNILTLISPHEYASKIHLVLKDAQQAATKTIYVSLNKTYNSLLQQFKENNIDISQIIFVDTITATLIEPKPTQNCVFLPSPENFIKMEEGILKITKDSNADLLVFDSLSSLITYKNHDEIVLFMTKMLASLSLFGCSTILTCLTSDENSSLINEMRMKVDKVIDLS